MVRIRCAEADDAESLLCIYRYYVENTAITFEWDVPSLEEFRERIRETQDFYPYIVAYDEDSSDILGYAYASHFNHRKAYEWCAETSIYVDRNHRKEGVGRLLYDNLERCLSSQGIIKLYACIAYSSEKQKELDSNSVCFHRALGYKQAGYFESCGYKFGKWYDMVWMEKLIGEMKDNPEPVRPFSSVL